MRAPFVSTLTLLALLALLALAPALRAPLHAQSDARVAARLDAETSRQVEQLLDAARRSRLPVEPLVDKALEGASKRAPGGTIVRAVQDLSNRLLEARQILGPQAPDPEVTAAAHALRGGLHPAALRRMHERRGRTTIVAALGVFQELRGLRVQADTATAAVVALQDAGVSPEQIAEYQREVARTIAVGGQPAMVTAINTDLVAGDGAFRNGSSFAESTANTPPTTTGGLQGTSGGTRPKRKP